MKKYISILLFFLLGITNMFPVSADTSLSKQARYGIRQDYADKYIKNLQKHIEDVDGVLSTRKYTEYARVVIALTSLEKNPKSFGGYNLLQPLAEYDNLISMGVNSVSYALIAFDCGNYEIPEPKKDYHGKVTTRDKLITAIINAQLKDGGWTLAGKNVDVDVTAMAIQALAPYYKRNENVREALEKALEKLSSMQQMDGGFQSSNNGGNESTAQVLTALSELRIDIEDKRFVKNGNTVVDGLLQYYKNGGFSHRVGGAVNQMATEQSMYALVAYYRSITDKNRLFDMSDGVSRLAYEQNTQESFAAEKKTEKKQKKNTKKKTSDKTEEKRKAEQDGNLSQQETEKQKETEEQKETKKEEKTENVRQKRAKEGQTTGNQVSETEDEAERILSSEETPSEKPHGKSEKEHKVGAAVGGGIIAGCIVGMVVGYILVRRRKKR